ncbi:MAG: hypothetical protein ACK5LS_09845 [Propioniciclava sp.]
MFWSLGLIVRGPAEPLVGLDETLPWSGWAAGGLLAALIVLEPTEPLFLFREDAYLGFQVSAAITLLLIGLGAFGRWRRTAAVPRATLPLRATLAARDIPYHPDGSAHLPLGERIGAKITVHVAALAQNVLLLVTVLVAMLVQVSLTWTAFLEGWILLLLALVLALEGRLRRWVSLPLGEDVPIPPLSEVARVHAWWASGWVITVHLTQVASVTAGGLRPAPLQWYLVTGAVVMVAGLVPWWWCWKRRVGVVAAYLRAQPARHRELVDLATAVGPHRFGPLPDLT